MNDTYKSKSPIAQESVKKGGASSDWDSLRDFDNSLEKLDEKTKKDRVFTKEQIKLKYPGIETDDYKFEVDRKNPTPENVVAMIDFLKAVHQYIDDESTEVIERKYLQGKCAALASMICLAYKYRNGSGYWDKTSPIQTLEFLSSHEKEEDVRNHYVVNIKDTNNEADKELLFDISGAQSSEEMREKLSKLWNVEPDSIKIVTFDGTPLYQTKQTEYCLFHLVDKDSQEGA
jgi:hypothetical protein